MSLYGIKHPVPDRVMQTFVIFDIWAVGTPTLRAERQERPDVKYYK